jgi:hypothetical protein
MLSVSSRARLGLLCIAGAIGLYFLSFFFRYVGYFLPPSGPAVQESFYLGLHVVWIPLIGTLLIGAIATLFVIGVWFVWGDRARFDATQRAYLGLAGLAFAAAFGAAVLRTALGLFLGFVYTPNLRGVLDVVNVGAAISLGFTLYWLLQGVGIRQARLAGIIALVSGSLSSGLAVLWQVTQNDGIALIGLAGGLISLTLWMSLFLWGSEELRLRSDNQPPAVPA